MRWPDGIGSGAVPCGIKDGDLDLGALVADHPVVWTGTFTRNAAAAAPVVWSRSLLGAKARAIVVNSGNANACTGSKGREAVEATARATASALGCDPREVLIASTGPIGIYLPVTKVVDSIPRLVPTISTDATEFSRAILTTDTSPKTAQAVAGKSTIMGVAKGAAMIAPNMATMLAFLATDAALPQIELDRHLRRAVSRTFDRISVDACESTNDSVFLLSTGTRAVDPAAFGSALEDVCKDLAEQIVGDAEGAARMMRIQVEGADTEESAVTLGKAVAASALWRAAVNGGDPNWGRVVSALGSVHRGMDLSKLEISVGPEVVFRNGEPCGSLDVARKAMEEPEFSLLCVVGDGAGAAEMLSADLSEAYVALNAEGST